MHTCPLIHALAAQDRAIAAAHHAGALAAQLTAAGVVPAIDGDTDAGALVVTPPAALAPGQTFDARAGGWIYCPGDITPDGVVLYDGNRPVTFPAAAYPTPGALAAALAAYITALHTA